MIQRHSPAAFTCSHRRKSVSKRFYEIGLRGLNSQETDRWKIHLSLQQIWNQCGYTSPASSSWPLELCNTHFHQLSNSSSECCALSTLETSLGGATSPWDSHVRLLNFPVPESKTKVLHKRLWCYPILRYRQGVGFLLIKLAENSIHVSSLHLYGQILSMYCYFQARLWPSVLRKEPLTAVKRGWKTGPQWKQEYMSLLFGAVLVLWGISDTDWRCQRCTHLEAGAQWVMILHNC